MEISDPTAGGITASYAMLGDIHLAEPGALIAFAGARVIQGTVKEELPEGFQKSEYVEKTGFVDLIVERKELSEKTDEWFLKKMLKPSILYQNDRQDRGILLYFIFLPRSMKRLWVRDVQSRGFF